MNCWTNSYFTSSRTITILQETATI